MTTQRETQKELVMNKTMSKKEQLEFEKHFETMEKFISLSFDEKRKMGLRGRKKVVEEFDEKIVINNYIESIRKIIDY